MKNDKRVFNTQDGREVLKCLSNIVWINKHNIKTDIASMSWHDGRQELMLWIFNILKAKKTI